MTSNLLIKTIPKFAKASILTDIFEFENATKLTSRSKLDSHVSVNIKALTDNIAQSVYFMMKRKRSISL